MASTVNVKNVLELPNAVPNDKIKRKPLATIAVPVAISKTENVVKVFHKTVDGKKKASFCEKENEVFEKIKDGSEDVKIEEKTNGENAELEIIDKENIENSIVLPCSSDASIIDKKNIENSMVLPCSSDASIIDKENIENSMVLPCSSDASIIDKENIENSMVSPCSSDASILEEDSSTSITETFEPHEDDWCFSKMLFLRVLEYEEEIQKYLLRLQVKNRPDPDFITKRKPEINEKMRTILVDWMTEVVEEYKMNSETLFLAVNFIDRFLSAKSIARSKFQLLGTAALFISSKYEEIYPPDIHEYVYITDNAYAKYEILSMEAKILQVLDFNISTPTAVYFLRKHLYSIGLELDLPQTVGIMAEYLCYIALLECNPSTSYLPNDIAVSAIILSASLFGIKINLSGETGQVFFPGFTAEQLKAHIVELQSCVDTLHSLRKSVKVENDALFKSGKPQQAIFSKFAQEKYYSISLYEIGSQEAPKLLL